jgi:ribonuclease P protein component
MRQTVETFRKSERLCSKKSISELFEKGRSFYSPGFQVIWMTVLSDIPFPAQAAISVSKKTFRRAVKRNLVKRRIREIYRREKHRLYEFLNKENRKVIFIMIFKGDAIPDYQTTEIIVKSCLERLEKEIIKINPRQSSL